MSYCRFSSNDFLCDVYVYEDVSGGFTTHVAGNKIVYKEPIPDIVDISDKKKWMKRYNKMKEMRKNADRINIDLKFAGESFNDGTAKECAERLLILREIGYQIPQHTIDALIDGE